jgi:cysteine-rich repeat protein
VLPSVSCPLSLSLRCSATRHVVLFLDVVGYWLHTGGGGGSGFANGLSGGIVLLQAAGTTAANSADPDLGGRAFGGTVGNGGHGRVIVRASGAWAFTATMVFSGRSSSSFTSSDQSTMFAALSKSFAFGYYIYYSPAVITTVSSGAQVVVAIAGFDTQANAENAKALLTGLRVVFSPLTCASATASASVSPVCGNGVVEGTEACDDNNAEGNDGCERDCSVTVGWTCSGNICSLVTCAEPSQTGYTFNAGASTYSSTRTASCASGW